MSDERYVRPNVLIIDIETSPNVADVWGLFDQTVSLSQLRESTRVIAFAAKWLDAPEVMFYSDFHDGHRDMILAAHALLGIADIVVHYNGTSFDIPHLNREFVEAGYDPPSPFKQVDLLRVVKKNFRFASNKLQHVSVQLGLEGKQEHEGHTLWVRCMAGEPEAWEEMRVYNVQDVRLTEKVYLRLLPWISNHPHMGLYVDESRPVCNRCGGTRLQKRGTAYTTLGAYQRYQCQGCGGWSRSGKRVNGVDVRGVAS